MQTTYSKIILERKMLKILPYKIRNDTGMLTNTAIVLNSTEGPSQCKKKRRKKGKRIRMEEIILLFVRDVLHI